MTSIPNPQSRRFDDSLTGYLVRYWPIVMALVGLTGAQAVTQFRVSDYSADRKIIYAHDTKIAVLEANIYSIQKSLEETNNNTQRILDKMDRRVTY